MSYLLKFAPIWPALQELKLFPIWLDWDSSSGEPKTMASANDGCRPPSLAKFRFRQIVRSREFEGAADAIWISIQTLWVIESSSTNIYSLSSAKSFSTKVRRIGERPIDGKTSLTLSGRATQTHQHNENICDGRQQHKKAHTHTPTHSQPKWCGKRTNHKYCVFMV